MPMRVLGVDACRTGWVAVELRAGAFATARVAATLREVLERAPQAAVVAVDIPLGLLDTGWRLADPRAKALLGARHSTVFAVPPRAVWEEPDPGAASRLCRELTGAGISRQALGLRTKVLEANQLWDGGSGRIREVHPEVSFREMAGTQLAEPKKTLAGQLRRRALLREHGIVIRTVTAGAGPDDIFDAAAAAWSAYRIASGEARCLPDPPQTNERGEELAIWY